MTRVPPPFDLILITEPALADPVTFAREALADLDQGSRVALQLRAKSWSSAQRTEAAYALIEITRAARAHLLINGDPELCALLHAEGVQLPETGPRTAFARTLLGPNARIGVSCHDNLGLRRAADEGADFALLGPWADVPHKNAALGPDRFAELCRAARLPVFALGGVDLAHIGATIAAGAHGVAVIRQAHEARDRSAWVSQALRALDRAHAVSHVN